MKKRILIVNTAQGNEWSYASSIRDLLTKTEVETVSFKRVKDVLDVAGYHGIILSGQPMSDESHTQKSVAKNFPWVRDVQVPLMGFCGGHQIIALAYGAKLIKNKEAEPKGFFAAYAKTRYLNDVILKGIRFGKHGNVFIVYNKHRDSVTLPPGFACLAETDKCKNALMRHKKKLVYGAQFHPEDPHYYVRKHKINSRTNQDSDSMVENFEGLVLKG